MPACMHGYICTPHRHTQTHTDTHTHTHMIVMLTSSIVACGKCANTVIMYMYSAYLDCFHYGIYIPIGFPFLFSTQRIVCSELMKAQMLCSLPLAHSAISYKRRKEREEREKRGKMKGRRKQWRGVNRNEQSE